MTMRHAISTLMVHRADPEAIWTRSAYSLLPIIINRADKDLPKAMEYLRTCLVPTVPMGDEWPAPYKRAISDCIKISQKDQRSQAGNPIPRGWIGIHAVVYSIPHGLTHSPLLRNNAAWTLPGTQHVPLIEAESEKIGGWNINGLIRAWTSGEFSRMIDTTLPDKLFIFEIKCSLMDIVEQIPDIQHFLEQRSYHAYFYWCDNPGGNANKWGSMLLTKELPKAIQFGFGQGHEELDKEGRFIIATFKHYTSEGSYVPCSNWDTTEEEPRRMEYDEAKRETCKEIERLISIGDNNCAKDAADASMQRSPESLPGCKPWERKNMAKFIDKCKLTDIYTRLNGPGSTADFSWSKTAAEARRGVGMRIDNILASEVFFTNKTKLQFKKCMLGTSFYSSDHRPIFAIIDHHHTEPIPGSTFQTPAVELTSSNLRGDQTMAVERATSALTTAV
jgi:exodeoxyribonuclease III